MSKSKEETEALKLELKNLMKCNKVSRTVRAIRRGFASWESYKDHLEKEISSIDVAEKVVKKVKEEKKKQHLTDMVIAFDTTGSMMSYINAVKAHVLQLVPSLFNQNPGLNISIVAFGDYCDMTSSKVFGKAYQVLQLTNDQNAIMNFITNAQNTSGGDTDEFYELVIKKIVEETKWRKGSNKNVLFIGDYGPHSVGYTFRTIVQNAQIDWVEEAHKAAAAGIIFDTLRILPNQSFYKRLADITGGVCLNFNNSQKTAKVVEATSLARGGKATEAAFMAKSMSSEVTEDKEISAVYSSYKTILKK